MPLQVKPSPSGFGAEVSGIDLCRPITASQYEEVENALSAHGVICFRNQPIDDEHQEKLIAWFGPPNVLAAQLNSKRLASPHFSDVSNLDDDGNIMMPDDLRRLYLKANFYWHSDMSMRQPPARVTILSARELPPPAESPNTEYADLRGAWAALPAERQRELDGLMIEHSVYASRSRVGYTEFSEETKKLLPPVQHPLVRTHARSGRKTFYMGAHASHVIGWPEEKGKALLEELVEYATQPRFRYVHVWQPRDIMMWDNSCTMHRALPFDDQKFRRELRWCSSRELEPV